ncbi:MAG: hypothetical protein AAGI72_16760 [Pseudomonadota bacterium]
MAFACAFLGCMALAASQKTQRRYLGTCTAGVALILALRSVGALFVAAVFGLAVLRDGAGVGSVMGMLLLTAASLCVALVIRRRRHKLHHRH